MLILYNTVNQYYKNIVSSLKDNYQVFKPFLNGKKKLSKIFGCQISVEIPLENSFTALNVMQLFQNKRKYLLSRVLILQREYRFLYIIFSTILQKHIIQLPGSIHTLFNILNRKNRKVMQLQKCDQVMRCRGCIAPVSDNNSIFPKFPF